jgi:hypothetical protein
LNGLDFHTCTINAHVAVTRRRRVTVSAIGDKYQLAIVGRMTTITRAAQARDDPGKGGTAQVTVTASVRVTSVSHDRLIDR